ncbi:MAG TPA: hypothetical protein VM325_08535 [Alphaproteobacteria bacterium]|nr:hypothetical protein [Alphaproteobacteria bacterium]
MHEQGFLVGYVCGYVGHGALSFPGFRDTIAGLPDQTAKRQGAQGIPVEICVTARGGRKLRQRSKITGGQSWKDSRWLIAIINCIVIRDSTINVGQQPSQIVLWSDTPMDAPAMAKLTEQERIVRQNYETFRAELQWMLPAHDGEFVVVRNRKVIGFFPSPTDAREFGEENFPDGRFSIQEVTERKAFISPHVYAVRDGKA